MEPSLNHYQKYKDSYKRNYEKNKEKRQQYNREYYKSYKTNRIECACGKNILEKNLRFHEASKFHISHCTVNVADPTKE